MNWRSKLARTIEFGSSLREDWGRAVLWLLFFGAACLTVVVLPVCYFPDRVEFLVSHDSAVKPIFALIYGMDSLSVFTIDRSGGSMICITLFLGVLIRYNESNRRIGKIRTGLRSERGEKNLAALDPAFLGLGRKFTVEHAHARLCTEMGLARYEPFLVAIGLIGTLMAFYLGFAQKLSELTFASLDQTTRELLTVVGTAAISSVAGIGLGMVFVRALTERLEARLEELRPWLGV